MIASWPLLSTLIWLPLGGALLVLLAGGQRPNLARWLALLTAAVTLLLSTELYTGFEHEVTGTGAAAALGRCAPELVDPALHQTMQFIECRPWMPTFDIHYLLGVDGFAVPLILLTTLFGVLVVIAGWRSITSRVHQYMASFLALQGLMTGVFAALDGLLFYVFFEAMLIPMFLVIGIWGGTRRVYATIKFFLYTFLGSIFMLIGLIWLYLHTGTFSVLAWHHAPLALGPQIWLFLGFLAAFAVKVPMWPVHTWLPDAHVEAPTGGSVILAAIMLKIGGYGFIRFSLPIAPDAGAALDLLMIVLSLIAVVYIGFVALAQQDMKKLIAYSSISHMGFVTLGLFIAFTIARRDPTLAGAALGVNGAMVQMISHGLVSGALFLVVGVLYDRMHTRQIADYGGVVNVMPWFALLAVLFFMANSGLPGTSGFVGEVLVIVAAFKANPWYGAIAGLTLILGAAYSLWLVKRVIFGDVANSEVAGLKDIGGREALVLGIIAAGVLLLGVWPAPLLDIMAQSVNGLLAHITISKV